MSGRGFSWRDTVLSDEEDEDVSDDDAYYSSRVGLSTRLHALANELSTVESKHKRTVNELSRQYSTLHQQHSELEETVADLKHENMMKDREIRSLKNKLRAQRSSTAVQGETLLLRMQYSTVAECLLNQLEATAKLAKKHPDDSELHELSRGHFLFLDRSASPTSSLALVLGSKHPILEHLDRNALETQEQADAKIFAETGDDDDDEDSEDSDTRPSPFDMFMETEFTVGNLEDIVDQNNALGVYRFLNDARLPREADDMRPLYNTLGQMLAKAVKHGHVDTCKLLLDRKANILFRDDTGRSLLHIAARSRNEGVLKLLLQAASRSPAHASAASSIPGQSFGLNLSFHLTAEDRLRWLDALDGQGRSALHSAARLKHSGCVALLLFHGCDVEQRTGADVDGETAMQLGTNNRVQVSWGDSSTMRNLFQSDLQNLWNRSARSALLYKAGEFEAALKCYSAALAFGQRAMENGRIQQRDMSRLYYNRGRAAVRCKQFSEALTCCDNALNLDQDYVSAMKMRATCKMELFDFDGACKDWKWVVRSASFDSDDRESTREQYRLARRYRNASHYDILGITKVASHKDIIKAYRNASINWHPDKQAGSKDGTARANALFQRINEAKQVLCDSTKRMMYDYERKYSFGKSSHSDDEISDDEVVIDEWPWQAAAAANAAKKRAAAAAREAEQREQQREFETREELRQQRLRREKQEQEQLPQPANQSEHTAEPGLPPPNFGAASSSTTAEWGGQVFASRDAGATAAGSRLAESLGVGSETDTESDGESSSGEESEEDSLEADWDVKPRSDGADDIVEEAEASMRSIEEEIARLSQHTAFLQRKARESGTPRSGDGLRMEAADEPTETVESKNGAAQKSSGMFAGMKGGFFKKKGKTGSSKSTGDHSQQREETTERHHKSPTARQYAGEEDDDATSPYAHYRKHNHEGAYWAHSAAPGASTQSTSKYFEEVSATDTSDASSSEEDDSSEEAHFAPPAPGMQNATFKASPRGDEDDEDDDNKPEAEPVSSTSKAASRYLFLIDFGFDMDTAMKLAELELDLEGYLAISGSLTKEQQWKDITEVMRADGIPVHKFEQLNFGMNEFVKMIQSQENPLGGAAAEDGIV